MFDLVIFDCYVEVFTHDWNECSFLSVLRYHLCLVIFQFYRNPLYSFFHQKLHFLFDVFIIASMLSHISLIIIDRGIAFGIYIIMSGDLCVSKICFRGLCSEYSCCKFVILWLPRMNDED